MDEKEKEQVKEINVREIISGIVTITAIIVLGIYGITLAKLGIDSQIALFLGVIIGGLGGFNIKKYLVEKEKNESGEKQ